MPILRTKRHMSAKTLKRLLLLPWRFSMGNRLTDGEKVVVSGLPRRARRMRCRPLFFVGGAILDMRDAMTEVNESLLESRHDVADMRRHVADMREALNGFGAEVSRRV